MIYYTYILQSQKNLRFYFGQTQNINTRLENHNKGRSKYTAKYTPWNLVWFKTFETRKEAFALEQQLKKMKSRKKIIAHITENPCVPRSENIQISDLTYFRESS